MSIPWVVSLLVPLASGFLLVSWLWPEERGPSLPLRASLAVGFGLGLSSVVTFVQLLAVGPDGIGPAPELALLVLLAVGYRLDRRRRQGTPAGPPVDAGRGRPAWPIVTVVLVLLASAVGLFVLATLRDPHGMSDALAIWNYRARVLVRCGDGWAESFTWPVRQLDYPLLVPAVIARTWLLDASEASLVPAVIAFLFTFATVGLLFGALRALLDARAGLLAAAVLLGTPAFVSLGADQYADIPIGFLFLATLVLLALGDRARTPSHRYALLAGIAAGLATWTKNEGLLFLLVVLAARACVARWPSWRAWASEQGAFLGGALPALLILVVFKAQVVTTQNDLRDSLSKASLVERVAEGRRHAVVAGGLARASYQHGNGALLAVAGFLALAGVRLRRRDLTALAVVAGQVAGYYLIYVLTSRSIGWHVQTSLDRLLMQLWPTLLFGLFLLLREDGPRPAPAGGLDDHGG